MSKHSDEKPKIERIEELKKTQEFSKIFTEMGEAKFTRPKKKPFSPSKLKSEDSGHGI
jgi:hypothetical protein